MNRVIQAGFANNRVRVVAIDSTEMTAHIQKIHDLYPMSTVIIGRVATASVLLGNWMSEKEKVSIFFEGEGPAGEIVARADNKLNVKAYIKNKKIESMIKENGHFDVQKAIGKGELHVIRDMELKSPVTSNVEIISGEIAEDIAYYMNQAEQIPSAVSLGVLLDKDGVRASGGVMLQVLDQSMSEEELINFEKRFMSLPSISNYLDEENDIRDIINIFGEADYIEEKTAQYKCDCNYTKVKNSMVNFDIEDLEDMKKEGKVEVKCEWCSKKYTIDEKDIDEIIEGKGK
ncbi:MAG: Hsp33 family molecular chaperone HslO [Thermotogota bacterium]